MITETDKQILQVIFVGADVEELKLLRKDIHGMIEYKSQQNLRNFKVGENIEWASKNKTVMQGVITKINTKTVHCSTSKGPWKIHISLIRKSQELVEA